MPTATTRSPMRERFREQVREDVKTAALDQLAVGGAQAISINAIAKQLGVSGPALYRYFTSRDDLLTALVIDAYSDMRDALAREVDAAAPGRGPEDRVLGLARAYRAWALAEPHRYELLFKPPLPGYDAHAEPLAAAARSLMGILLGVLHDLDPADPPPAGNRSSGTYQHEDVLAARSAGTATFQLAVSVWSRVHGIVSLELGGGFSAMQLDADALFEHELQVLLDRLDRGREDDRT